MKAINHNYLRAKPKTVLSLAVLLATLGAAESARSQVYGGLVGYANVGYGAGYSLIANPLQQTPDDLNSIMPVAPLGTTLSLWNSALNTFNVVSTFGASGWSTDFTLNPGTGALMDAPSAFTNTWVGTVLNANGQPLQVTDTLTPPPPFSGPNGLYLLSCQAPLSLTNDVFTDVLGRGPKNGEQFITITPQGQYVANTYENGVWSDGPPTLAVGDSALYNVGPVPEPSTLSFCALALGAFKLAHLHRRKRPQPQGHSIATSLAATTDKRGRSVGHCS